MTEISNPVKKMSFFWSPNRQRFACDETASEGHGTICTDPSHDLVHLIVAANEKMFWLPHGERDAVCWAEYNAVFLENLFDKTCNAIAFGTAAKVDALQETIQYMDWFVSEHYAPFPVAAPLAVRRFCEQIEPFRVACLFPYYLQLKTHERTNNDYRSGQYQLEFTSRDRPPVDELGWLAQWSIYRQLKAAKTALGLPTPPSDLGGKIEQALMKMDALGGISGLDSLQPSEHSQIDNLEQRLSYVEKQLVEVKNVLLSRIEEIARCVGSSE